MSLVNLRSNAPRIRGKCLNADSSFLNRRLYNAIDRSADLANVPLISIHFERRSGLRSRETEGTESSIGGVTGNQDRSPQREVRLACVQI